MDFPDSNFLTWSTFFNNTFRKFCLMDHVDYTMLKLDDADWTQTDYCIVYWLHSSVSREILNIIIKLQDTTAYSSRMAITGLFLDNSMQQAIYAQQELHSLYQGELSITEYCGRLKRFADTLRNVDAPLAD
ncbi:uncharacterized protein LOC133908070 [Phragmites australis]|uniref:uncharacterized protein LOC133908070 n=1 Tax=Phragmites australis TaxID=29695 RepID=UPI002D79491A|nr:uncharacterized protein LOC133908070 [Phragmites australis]